MIVINTILSLIPIIGWLLGLIINFVALILWLFLMYKAYTGSMYKLPWLGDLAERQVQ